MEQLYLKEKVQRMELEQKAADLELKLSHANDASQAEEEADDDVSICVTMATNEITQDVHPLVLFEELLLAVLRSGI